MVSADMFADRQFNYLAIAGSFNFGYVGLSWINAGITDVPLTGGSSEDYLDNYFLLTYANQTGGMRFGANFTIANNDVAGETGVGGDFGAQWDIHPEARIGVVAQQLGLKVGENSTPFNIRFGIAVMPDILSGFTFPVEIQKTQNVEDLTFRIGSEYMHQFDNSDFGVAIRAGVDDGSFALGGGLSFQNIRFDYAYVEELQDFMNENHRFSVTGNF